MIKAKNVKRFSFGPPSLLFAYPVTEHTLICIAEKRNTPRKQQKHIWGGAGEPSEAEQGFHWQRNRSKTGTSASKMDQIGFPCLTLFLWAITAIEGEYFTLLHGCHSFASKSWPVVPSVHITFSANSSNAPISLKAGKKYTYKIELSFMPTKRRGF